MGAMIKMAINTIGHAVKNAPSHCFKKVCAKKCVGDLVCVKIIMPETIMAVLADMMKANNSVR